MRVYQVGGAVRDELLGQPVVDHDWVVVGATPAMLRAQGYRPVGRDFPVFLHPTSHEEYALARTERKSGRGYHGFIFHAAPDVTLEQDLARRDLTINAMARGEDGALVDPFGGQADLAAGILRHVGPAFAEDPVRILRVARFSARFPDFLIAPETLALMRGMVTSGEVDALVAERVWQELAKGLMSERPSRMLQVLADCGALARLLPEVAALAGVPQRPETHPEGDVWQHTLAVVDAAAERQASLPVRFAGLLHDLGKALTPAADLPRHPGHEVRGEPLVAAVCDRWRVPAACHELALLAARCHGAVHRVANLDAAARLALLERADAMRRPQRFEDLLAVCEADYFGRRGVVGAYRPATRWQQALAAVQQIDAGAIARATPGGGEAIRQRLAAARLARLQALPEAGDA